MWIVELIKGFLATLNQGLILGTKLAPTEQIQTDNHVIARPRLLEEEYIRRLRSSKSFLILHHRLKVDTFVAIRFNDLQPEDKERFSKALHEMFPRR